MESSQWEKVGELGNCYQPQYSGQGWTIEAIALGFRLAAFL
ncbi:hypothetical protein [Floridanema evergladense]|uniref:Uncharacterized protein n=1 Tax=Floridaenema evergladense BLCC-F167 TaxID=3153639 RepID=A0ABV4WKC4_9CYAN